ncbi:hypothetical protein [Nocardioides litoris]|uniref:hypothetical protein n=1 Tax=Nocardioides litoris TaxID=1926648 RepID=UPI0011206533|nr:hypothetical protein [Nocardioides litoris]
MDAPDEGQEPSHRTPRATREAVATLTLVGVLVLASLAIVVWSQRSDGGGGGGGGGGGAAEPAAGSTSTSSAGETTQATETASPAPTPRPMGQQAPAIKLAKLADVDEAMARKGKTRVPTREVESLSFVVSSFNILGASHTRGPGARRGFGSAEARLGGQIELLDAKGVSVAGLQESQGPQISGLLGRTGDTWGIFPGLQLGELAADNSIIWRQAEWTLVQAETSQIPYFGGRPREMPHVLLEHRETGRRVWFGNYHNPANIGGNEAGNRARALAIEADLSRRLSADGTPVVITGDMNDRGAFACPFAAQSGMVSADGAKDEGGQCFTPRQMNVDWIWGTRDLTWTGFLTDYQTEDRKLSDHPMITATANLPGVADRQGCVSRITRKGAFWYCPS